MNRHVMVVLLLVLCVDTPAMAADAPPSALETVLVQTNSLDGIWKIGFPIYKDGLSLLRGFRGPLKNHQNMLCRIDDRIVRCIGPALAVEGTVSVNGREAHFAWGTPMARPVIDATFESATQFGGELTFKLSGIPYTAPDPVSGTKLNLSAITPGDDKDGLLLKRVLAEMNSGEPSEVFDMQAKDIQVPPHDELRLLGAVQSALYLGESGEFLPAHSHETAIPAKYRIPTDYKVYDVEFANGERLCGLRHGADGKINGFKCV